MSRNCRFIPETPEAHRDSIHHICISICTLTSHTHPTLNKLHSEWKHAACWSLMCLHCVHTPTSHIHHVELAVCLVFLFFFSQVIIMLKAQQHNSTLSYIVPSLLTHFFLSHRCRFLDLQPFVAASGSSDPGIVKHAWRVCLPWLMDQTKTSKAFQKSLHAVSKLRSRRSSHSPSQALLCSSHLRCLVIYPTFIWALCVFGMYTENPSTATHCQH